MLQSRARDFMVETPLSLTPAERMIVEQVVRDHCNIRGWELHIVNVRTQHIHAVVRIERSPGKALVEFKAWSTRRLKNSQPDRQQWWTEGGSKRPVWNENDLEAVILYVRDLQ